MCKKETQEGLLANPVRNDNELPVHLIDIDYQDRTRSLPTEVDSGLPRLTDEPLLSGHDRQRDLPARLGENLLSRYEAAIAEFSEGRAPSFDAYLIRPMVKPSPDDCLNKDGVPDAEVFRNAVREYGVQQLTGTLPHLVILDAIQQAGATMLIDDKTLDGMREGTFAPVHTDPIKIGFFADELGRSIRTVEVQFDELGGHTRAIGQRIIGRVEDYPQ